MELPKFFQSIGIHPSQISEQTAPEIVATNKNKLHSAQQLLITAQTPTNLGVLAPGEALDFLREIFSLTERSSAAESLVYSTPANNTGWTAFSGGFDGHVAFHHWDQAAPNLLQLDIYGTQLISVEDAIDLVISHWSPSSYRIVLIDRADPRDKISSKISVVYDDIELPVEYGAGLGPGPHLHAMYDYTSNNNVLNKVKCSEELFRIQIENLVKLLGMRLLTGVYTSVIKTDKYFEFFGIVGITTSHVSMRLICTQEMISASIDIFSCKKFAPQIVTTWFEALGFPIGAERGILYNRYPSMKMSIFRSSGGRHGENIRATSK